MSVFLTKLNQFLQVILAFLSRQPAPQRILGGVVLLLSIWLLPAWSIWSMGQGTALTGTLCLILIYVLFVMGLQPWGKQVRGYSQPLYAYGLKPSQENLLSLMLGVILGGSALGIMVLLEGAVGWLQWHLSSSVLPVVGMGLVVALPVGWAEELLFRGWMLDELEQDYSLGTALGVNSLIFAALHYLKPWSVILESWPQFLGLCLLGITLGWAKRRQQGQLGLAIGVHAGLVWSYYILDVGELIDYTQVVPAWVTGVNRNPLAGVVGLTFLGMLALAIRLGRWYGNRL